MLDVREAPVLSMEYSIFSRLTANRRGGDVAGRVFGTEHLPDKRP